MRPIRLIMVVYVWFYGTYKQVICNQLAAVLTLSFRNSNEQIKLLMKKTFLIIYMINAFAFSAKSQNTLTTEQQQVQKAIIEMFQGFADLNPEKIRGNCTADIMVLENGVVWNLDTLVLKVNERKSQNFKRINKLDFKETKVEGNIAWTIYNNEADITLNGQSVLIKWLESAVLIKEGNEWKIRLLHSTLVERIKK